jgi:acetyl esterase/lipase
MAAYSIRRSLFGTNTRKALKYCALLVGLSITLSLVWLRWESSQPRDEWFTERQGQIKSVITEESVTDYGQLAESVRLTSDSGLQVNFRIIRAVETDAPLSVLLILGGHRTGSDAVDLFGDVGERAIVGVDYPYDGPDKVKGVIPIARTISLARQAFLDTVPAVSLILDWLLEQDWIDKNKITLVGGSLGAPFAATAAARDQRITSLMLVHAAADNRLWLEVQVARRVDTKLLHYPLSNILYWLAYGPVLDTSKHVAAISPRPVLIIGASDDERTPADQAGLLFDAARDPKRLRISGGQHIQSNRKEVISELRRIAEEEQAFLSQF